MSARFLAVSTSMSEPASLPTVPVTPRIIPADSVYAALNDSCRRAVFAALFTVRRSPGRWGGSLPRGFGGNPRGLSMGPSGRRPLRQRVRTSIACGRFGRRWVPGMHPALAKTVPQTKCSCPGANLVVD
jgi:hypothetical protein